MNDPEARATRAALVAALTERLRRICSDWPDSEFNALVGQIADITLKYEGRTTVGTYDRRSAEKLVAELKAALERSQSRRGETSGGEGAGGGSVTAVLLAVRAILSEMPIEML